MRTFPAGFLWGVATSGHQTEGDNTDSDTWFLEHVRPTVFREPSGRACDGYRLWREDLDLVAGLGLGAYRFSVEWARVEPAEGEFNDDALAHYAGIIERCRSLGLAPVVTFNHFTSPHWFAGRGGWLDPAAPELFSRYCGVVMDAMGDGIHTAITMNEPNLARLLSWMPIPESVRAAERATLETAGRAAGVARYRVGNVVLPEEFDAMANGMTAGHLAAKAAIKARRPDLPVGLSLAIVDDQYVDDPGVRDRKRAEVYHRWLELAREDDFIGVQNYERARYDGRGQLPPPDGTMLNQMGSDIYPPSLAGAVRYAHETAGVPVLVTEHGLAHSDDRRRAMFLGPALRGLLDTIEDGVPVLGYLHWTLLDNFEWIFGYATKLGLVAVDRTTFARTPKPSAAVYAAIARTNAIPDPPVDPHYRGNTAETRFRLSKVNRGSGADVTTTRPLHVLIAGGGLSGLATAHGLIRNGHTVEVFERDGDLSRKQGYYLHMNPFGGEALRSLLPADLFELYLETSRQTYPRRESVVLNDQFQQLSSQPHLGPPDDGDRPHTGVHRRTLRQILTARLGDVLRTGTAVTGYDEDADGVTVHLSDGSTARGDILVGADGIRSAVRATRLPQVPLIPTGVEGIGVYGRTPLTPELRAIMPADLMSGVVIAVDRKGSRLLIAAFDPRRPADEAARAIAPDVQLDPVPPYVMVSCSVTPDTVVPPSREWTDETPAVMRESMLRAVQGWHPTAAALVGGMELDSIFMIPFGFVIPAESWAPSRVTLVGDSAHAMLPTIGMGANLSLRDAQVLVDQLGRAGRGEVGVVDAIGEYERDMREVVYPFHRMTLSHDQNFGGGALAETS